MRSDARNYYIVKHGLDAFEALPNFVWHTGWPESYGPPRGYRMLEEGDRWIGYAYTTSDNRERPLSLVTGFYECVKEAWYGDVPRKARHLYTGPAWMIKGRTLGTPLRDPVVIRPIARFLSKPPFSRATITRISRREFEALQSYTQRHRLKREDIPGLGRDPRNEQEVLTVVAVGQKKLGIERIVQAQTAFPDMLVKLKGKADEVYLELEVGSTSFLNHGHKPHVRGRRFKEDKKPVAVLCWIDDDESGAVKSCVHRVFELRTLLRKGTRIHW
jgi:hypothetical protein